jgi:3-oxoacyl-[acyl-carrier protein] reductase
MNNQTVLVTGAANGIGRALTLVLLSEGSKVLACDNDGTGLESLRDETDSQNLFIYVADLSKTSQIKEFWEWVESNHPNVSSLINNAGVYHGKPYLDYSKLEADEAIALNLTTPLFLSEQFSKHIIEHGRTGSVVNVTSVAGEVGSSDAIYGSTKAALIGLTKSHAMNFGPKIRVNAVSPAAVRETAIFDLIPEYRRKEYLRQEYLDSPITPQSVAAVILFLIGDSSKNITGKTIPVDNGCYPR